MQVRFHPNQNIFESSHIGKESDILIGAGDAQPGDSIWWEAIQKVTVEMDLTIVNAIEAGNTIENCCLPCAVRSDDAYDGALIAREVEFVYGDQTTELLHQTLDVEIVRHLNFPDYLRSMRFPSLVVRHEVPVSDERMGAILQGVGSS